MASIRIPVKVLRLIHTVFPAWIGSGVGVPGAWRMQASWELAASCAVFPAYLEIPMNPFLDPTLAEPAPMPFRLRGTRYRAARTATRLAGRVALAAGLGLAAFEAGAVDVNSASQSQLEDLRGVGPKTAAAIVSERRQGGAFLSFEDLAGRVRGLGGKRLARLRSAGLTLAGQGRPPAEMLVNTPAKTPGKSRGKAGWRTAVD